MYCRCHNIVLYVAPGMWLPFASTLGQRDLIVTQYIAGEGATVPQTSLTQQVQ